MLGRRRSVSRVPAPPAALSHRLSSSHAGMRGCKRLTGCGLPVGGTWGSRRALPIPPRLNVMPEAFCRYFTKRGVGAPGHPLPSLVLNSP